MYWTIVTVTTVGYGDFNPSPEHRLTASVYIIFATGILAANVAATIATFIEIRKKASTHTTAWPLVVTLWCVCVCVARERLCAISFGP